MIYHSLNKTAHTKKKKVEKGTSNINCEIYPQVLSASKKSKKSGTGPFHPINPPI